MNRRKTLLRMTPRRCLDLLVHIAKAEVRIDSADRNGMSPTMVSAREAASNALGLARAMLREAVDAELQLRGTHARGRR